ETRPVGRPFHHPLHRRHEGEAAFRLLAKEPEIGRRIAHPEHAHAAHVGEALAYAAPDEAPGDDAETLGIEIAQIDDIDRHGDKVAWILILSSFRTARSLWQTALQAVGEQSMPFARPNHFKHLRHGRHFILTRRLLDILTNRHPLFAPNYFNSSLVARRFLAPSATCFMVRLA